MFSGRGLCDEPITRLEESYRLWRVVVCDLETSKEETRSPLKGCEYKPTMGCDAEREMLIPYTDPNGLNSNYNGNNNNNNTNNVIITLISIFSFCPHLTLLVLDAFRIYKISLWFLQSI